MSSMIRNYLGYPWGIEGRDLMERAERQAVGFGAGFVTARKAVGLRAEGQDRVLTLSHQREVRSRTIVISTGVSYRRLEVPGLDSFIGAGVVYGATFSETRALEGLPVHVLGGGNSAGQAAVQLANSGANVSMLLRSDSLAKRMSNYLVRQIELDQRILVRLNTRIAGAVGNQRLEGLLLHDSVEDRTEEVPAAALFIFIGAEPHSEWLRPQIVCDDRGFILTGRDIDSGSASAYGPARQPLLLETSMPGVFAAGDVRYGSAKRVAAAVGEGATAVLLVNQYLDDLP
jgi:thioredoxin reductase (NADPH)